MGLQTKILLVTFLNVQSPWSLLKKLSRKCFSHTVSAPVLFTANNRFKNLFLMQQARKMLMNLQAKDITSKLNIKTSLFVYIDL